MKNKEELNATLSEKESDRLAFIVYRKAMVYVSAMIVLAVAILGFWGYDDWNDLKAKIRSMEKKAFKADSVLDKNLKNIKRFDDELGDERNKLISDREENLKSLVRLELLEETLREEIKKNIRENKEEIDRAIGNAKHQFETERSNLSEKYADLNSRIEELDALKHEIRDHLDSLKASGSTMIVLQSNKSTFLKGFGIRIKLGDLKKDHVQNVEITFEETGEKLGKNLLRYEEEFSFVCPNCGSETLGVSQMYHLKPIVRLNQPLIHDLLIAQLRWNSIKRLSR